MHYTETTLQAQWYNVYYIGTVGAHDRRSTGRTLTMHSFVIFLGVGGHSESDQAAMFHAPHGSTLRYYSKVGSRTLYILPVSHNDAAIQFADTHTVGRPTVEPVRKK